MRVNIVELVGFRKEMVIENNRLEGGLISHRDRRGSVENVA